MDMQPSQFPVEPAARPKLPGSLQAATILMFVGGGFGILGGFAMLTLAGDGLGFAGAIYLVGAVVTIWLAVMMRRGRNWARVTATVLLAVDMLFFLSMLSTTPSAGVGFAVHGLLIGLLWSASAREYFRQVGHEDRPAESTTDTT